MNDYLLGTDVLGADWGKPALIDDPEWGMPVLVEGGGGGHHGGHHGHGHGGGPAGLGPWWGGGYWNRGPSYDVDDFVETELLRCIEYDANGKCTKYAPTDVLGEDAAIAEVLGMVDIIGLVDINQAQRQMDALTPVTIGVANSLVRGGMQAINGAIAGAMRPGADRAMFGMATTLPGETARKNVLGKLKWHQDNIASFVDQNMLYPNFLDLKKWVMQAWIEGNAVETGAAYLDTAWSTMWAEIRTALAAIPAQVRTALSKAASDIVKNVTGLPIWAWLLIGTGIICLVGGIAYVIINSKAGAAVAGVAARTYMR
jgi:hypothetical protein